MSLKRAWQLLNAWWLDGDDAEKPPTGSGAGYVPTLQADDTVKWRAPTASGGLGTALGAYLGDD